MPNVNEYPLTASLKRKGTDSDQNGLKSKKRRKIRKLDTAADGNLDLDSGLNLAIGKMDRRLLADFVAQRTKRFSPNLSPVELEDLHLPGTELLMNLEIHSLE